MQTLSIFTAEIIWKDRDKSELRDYISVAADGLVDVSTNPQIVAAVNMTPLAVLSDYTLAFGTLVESYI